VWLCAVILGVCAGAVCAAERRPFVITVVDEQTGRGVPLVELTTVNHVRFVTDSAGVVAFDEPGMMGRRVFFTVFSHGYEFPKDGLGMRGVALNAEPGGAATIKIKRINIAERLYRVTGQGIYRDTILAGRQAPIEQPLLNAEVVGQDSVQRAIYRGKIHWFWGDTSRVAYPLGHFGMAGAVSDLPGQGGLDPSVGVNLKYFVDANGFSRPMVPGQNLRWIDGVMVVKDEQGRERLVAKCEVLKSLSQPLGRKLIVYNDEKDQFEDWVALERDEPLCPRGHPVRHAEGGVDYFYFPAPYPLLRVRAEWEAIRTPAAYEGYTCLAPGSRYRKGGAKVERDANGKLVWGWKPNTPPVSEKEEKDLVAAGVIKAEEGWYHLRDVETKGLVMLHAGGSVAWNEFRKKWVMIAVQQGGKSSFLGEVWYAEADGLTGPWRWARKVVTHDRYSLYNPVHHPFFDQEGGKVIYFEGTYSYTFSRQGEATPRYDYNQVMYRLDLGDARLRMPGP
jgi:hypothetical protein